ncbi:MAG: hypothetical protein ACK55I_11605, partial [bacterium]
RRRRWWIHRPLGPAARRSWWRPTRAPLPGGWARARRRRRWSGRAPPVARAHRVAGRPCT